ASTLLNQSGMWSPDAIERALAHGESDAARGAYHRGPHWDGCSAARFCLPVIQLKFDFADVPIWVPDRRIGKQAPSFLRLAFAEEVDAQIDPGSFYAGPSPSPTKAARSVRQSFERARCSRA